MKPLLPLVLPQRAERPQTKKPAVRLLLLLELEVLLHLEGLLLVLVLLQRKPILPPNRLPLLLALKIQVLVVPLQ